MNYRSSQCITQRYSRRSVYYWIYFKIMFRRLYAFLIFCTLLATMIHICDSNDNVNNSNNSSINNSTINISCDPQKYTILLSALEIIFYFYLILLIYIFKFCVSSLVPGENSMMCKKCYGLRSGISEIQYDF